MGAGGLSDDLAGHTLPGELLSQREGDAHGRIQVRPRSRGNDDRHHHEAGEHDYRAVGTEPGAKASTTVGPAPARTRIIVPYSSQLRHRHSGGKVAELGHPGAARRR